MGDTGYRTHPDRGRASEVLTMPIQPPLPPLRRRHLLQASAAGLACAAVPAAQAHAPRGPLQIVGPWDIGGLQPAISGHVFTRLQIAETLLGAHDHGQAAPALAQRWEVAGDGLTWHFVLRPQARFHDGSPVRADSVVRSLELARATPAPLRTAPIRAVEAVGDHTVRIRLSAPYASLPALLAHSSSLVLAPASYDRLGQVRSIIGSGPYRIVALAPPISLETAVFDGYDGPAPAIQRVRYMAASRAETRALMAEGGQADLAYGLDPASLQRLRLRRHLHIAAVTLPRTAVIKLNAGLPALQDLRARQALSLCIDRAGIARAILREPELAAHQLLPPTLPDWHDPTLPPLQHDPEAAMRLLRDAGWQRHGDGLRNPQGQVLRLALRTFPDRPELPIIATALQAQWREAGIAVEVQIGNSGNIPLGHRDGSLQLGLAARNYATLPDPTATLAQDFAPAGGDWGAMGWQHPKVSQHLAELMRGRMSASRAAQLRREVVQVLHTELPVIPVAWYRQQVALSRRISGVSLDPLERSYRLTDMQWTS